VKTFALCAAFMLFTLGLISAQEAPDNHDNNVDKKYLTFNQGATASWLTRVIKQTERSNFVFRDFLPGVYFGAELRNVKYIVPMARLAAYYPISSTFNKMPQIPVTPLHYAADMAVGLRFEPLNMKYLRFNVGPALHMFFLNSDRWNYFNLGAAAVAGIELPIVPRWTLLVDGYASIDNGNLGANRHMEPFDIAWQYQVDIGFRYSKKKLNDTSLFARKDNQNEYLLR